MNTSKKRYEKLEILRLLGLATIVFTLMFGTVFTSGKTDPSITASDQRKVGEEPFNLIHSAFLETGRAAQQTITSIPPEAFSYEPFTRLPLASVAMIQQQEKIHPKLKQRLKGAVANEGERVIINFRDNVAIPRFPGRVANEPPDSLNNRLASAEAETTR
jgi:hypothetical protein